MIRNIFLLILFISVYSCQSIKDGLSGKKYESSDEFLIIKKNPLVLPPEFNKLPTPDDPEIKDRQEQVEAEIDNILSKIKTEEMSSEKEKISESKSTEDFVLDQIKN
mgnify:FL=1